MSCNCKACKNGGRVRIQISPAGVITRIHGITEEERRLKRLQRRNSRGKAARRKGGRRG